MLSLPGRRETPALLPLTPSRGAPDEGTKTDPEDGSAHGYFIPLSVERWYQPRPKAVGWMPRFGSTSCFLGEEHEPPEPPRERTGKGLRRRRRPSRCLDSLRVAAIIPPRCENSPLVVRIALVLVLGEAP